MSDLLSNNSNLRVPKGFQILLHGLTTEVLREQPKDLWEFGEKYLASLVKIRTSTGVDPILHGVKLDERLATNTAFTDGSVDASNPEQEAAAMKIQTNYRQHSAKMKVDAMKEDEAAAKIQAGLRGYMYRQQVREEHDREAADEEVPTTSGNTLTVDTVKELEKKSATPDEAIKETSKTDETETAGGTASEPSITGDVLKGDNSEISKTDPMKSTAKQEADVKQSKDEMDKQVGKDGVGESDTSGQPTKIEEVTKSKASKEDSETDSVDKAAVTIQAGYRGYKVRKDSKKPE